MKLYSACVNKIHFSFPSERLTAMIKWGSSLNPINISLMWMPSCMTNSDSLRFRILLKHVWQKCRIFQLQPLKIIQSQIMKLEFDFECPRCKRKSQMKVEEIVPSRRKKCPRCGADIEFSGDDGRKMQRAFDDFEKSMKNMFR